MAMERDNYRINLEAVLTAFPDNPLPTLTEVGRYVKKDIRTLRKDKEFIGMCRYVGRYLYITRESLAHWLSGK